MNDFFKCVMNLEDGAENITATVIKGKNINSKAVFSDGNIIYLDNDDINWEEIFNIAINEQRSKILDLNGEKIYVEFIKKRYKAVICGAGHISIPIIKICNMLEIPVTVIDDRINFTNNALMAGAKNVICEPFDKALERISGDRGTFFIIVTRGHRYDQDCLLKIIEKENAYIGMIGSKSRVKKVLDYLEQNGVERKKLDRVYTPIGLKIGAETPEEIAISIMAEIIQVKNKEIGSSSYTDEIIDALVDEKNKDIKKAIVTIVSRKGSAPREVGTKMLIFKDGTIVGTIGGGCIEADIRQLALSCIDNNTCKLVNVDMTGQEAEEEGMVCGGIVDVYIESINE